MDQTAYVFLISSEEFFYTWLMREKFYIPNIFTIGNLSKANARKYFTKILAASPQNSAISFDDLFKITGFLSFIK